MKNHACLIILLCFMSSALLSVEAADRGPIGKVRVGIFPFMPFNYIDSSGVAQGLNPDLLREIVSDESWRIEFVQGSWAEGLERLQNQEIDLMVSVAYSPERAEIMDYSYESVAELWGQVFLRPEDYSKNINDLDGKRIGVMRKDISGKNFIETAEKFGVHCEIVEFSSHGEVFNAVRQRVVEAGVAPQHFGLRHAKDYDLVASSILFSPFSIYFASKKGTQHELLSHIDAHLAEWKKDKDSYYYQRLNYWLANRGAVSRIPDWLMYAALIACLTIVFFAGFTLLLRRTVRNRTRELAESEGKLLEAQEIARMGRWELDLTANRLMWSDGIYTLFEVDRQNFTASYEAFVEFVHPDDRTLVDRAYRESVKNKTPYGIEHRLLMRDGRVKWVSEIGRTMYDKEGRPIRSVGTVQDITERKRAETDLLKSRERYRTLVHTAMDGFWVLDTQGRFMEVNETYCRMSGYSEEELLTMTVFDMETTERVEDVNAHLQKIVAEGEDRFESVHRRKDGCLFDVEISIQYRSGEDAVFVAFLRDITGYKRAEEEKKNLQSQLLQALKMEAIGTLAGGIAHDFNNILAAVLGYAELAREGVPRGSVVEQEIAQIIQAGNRAKDLVRQILDFSRQAETDKIPLQPGIIVKETLKLLRSSLPTTIAIEQDIDMDSGLILADRTQLHQIIMNLCTNAFHAMEEAGGTLSVSLNRQTLTDEELVNVNDILPGPFVQISIRDNGPGIPPAIREKIFNPYFTTKETGKGSGMGLAIVHGIVKSFGGFITCHSQVGKGTVFQVNLPVVQAEARPETTSLVEIAGGSERILFVDDEKMLADLGKTMLERLGYSVTTQTSSIEALLAFTHQPEAYDLVITDQTMPRMTGVDMAREMLTTRPDLPIILCTGYSSLISEEKIKAWGIKGLALKPLTKKIIADLIRQVLDQGKIVP